MKIDRYVTLLVLAVIPLVTGEPVITPDRMTPASEQAAQSSRAADATTRAVAAAKAYLATLDDKQRVKATVELNPTTRVSWSNLPTGIAMQNGALERNGLKLGALSAAQQEAALALVAAPLSQSGFQKVMNIVNADEDLEQTTAPKRPPDSRIKFGRAEYYLAILGTPSVSAPWMIQFGGHHLAINVTMAGKSNVLTPSHTGAQPAKYTLEGRTIRPLGNENDKGFALINALDPAKQKQAILNYQVADTVWGPGTEGKVIQPEGVRVSSFNGDERAKLLDLVSEWVGILNDESAGLKMAEIKANLAETWFAWSGPTTNGSGAYFRIQGPNVMIEYAPQGKGANTDHIHTFYRDPTNDYGAKIVAQDQRPRHLF
jgi:Protein of unknown function (DUF3500)